MYQILIEIVVEFDDVETDLQGILHFLQQLPVGRKSRRDIHLLICQFPQIMYYGMPPVLYQHLIGLKKGRTKFHLFFPLCSLGQSHGEQIIFAILQTGDSRIQIKVHIHNLQLHAQIVRKILCQLVMEAACCPLVNVKIRRVVKCKNTQHPLGKNPFKNRSLRQNKGFRHFLLLACDKKEYTNKYNKSPNIIHQG